MYDTEYNIHEFTKFLRINNNFRKIRLTSWKDLISSSEYCLAWSILCWKEICTDSGI